MPGKQHISRVGAEAQRQYELILHASMKEGRYGKRAKAVASRTVLKQHRAKHHRKGE
jgi:hypothetical protein